MSRKLRVLVACEFSGVVREAFRALGHDAWSCDLLPAEDGSAFHMQTDALEAIMGKPNKIFMLRQPWDLIIAHPPCTFMANSGVPWLYLPRTDGNSGRSKDRDPLRWDNMRKGAQFFADLWNACGDTPRCFENPIMHSHATVLIDRFAPGVPLGKHPDFQFIDPRDFGHPETKRTGLYLKGLPHLTPTKRVHSEAAALTKAQRSRVHYASPGPDRWKERSRTLHGVASAMAAQYSEHLLSCPTK